MHLTNIVPVAGQLTVYVFWPTRRVNTSLSRNRVILVELELIILITTGALLGEAHLGHNDTGCNDNLLKATPYRGINYFITTIPPIVTFLEKI